MRPIRASASVLGVALLAALGLGGCPAAPGVEYIEGGVDTGVSVGGPGSVEVLTPASNLLITGGTQVEVNWRGSVPSRFSVFNVFVDPDTDPNNGNEVFAFESLPITTSSVLVDTTRLQRGSYNVGVSIEQLSALVTADYAPGRITIDQRPTLFFSEPRQSVQFDRNARINPTIRVAWTLEDPDSTNTVDIFLDPDSSPNGNEILLYRSASATGDSFTFDLPTAQFAPGEYRILASVTGGTSTVSIYAPAVIRLLARLSGAVDLRKLGDPNAAIRGAIFEGFNPGDNAGSLVTHVPDIDGDGLDDFLIMAQFGKPRFAANAQRTGVGEGYLIYGRQRRFSGQINLNSVGSLIRGEIYTGVLEVTDPIRPSRGVTSFAVLSDWDNDGIRDFVFGVPFTDSVAVSPLDTPGYFRTGCAVVASSQSITGFTGGRVLNIGDFGVFTRADGDSTVDVIECQRGFVGPKAPAVGTGWSGFYADYGFGITQVQWLGARFSSNEFGDQTGESVGAYRCATFLDTCGLIVSSPSRNPNTNVTSRPDLPAAGVVSVYFRPAGFNPWNLGDGSIPLEGPYLYILDDVRIDTESGQPFSPGFSICDTTAPCVCTANPLTWPEPRNTARFYGGFAGAGLNGCTAVGDINADGIQDLLFGSPLSADSAGSTFIVFGRLEGLVLQEELGAELNIEEITRPVAPRERVFDGVRVVGAPGERLGQSQGDAGDFNGDGLKDVVIGSPFTGNRAGGAAVFYGSRTVINLTEREIPYAELPQRGLGVLFVGETAGDLAGARVSSAGDVDRDGFDDLLIAAPNRSIFLDENSDGIVDIDRTECGVVYLIYGGPDFERRTTPGGDPGVLSLRYCGTEYLPGAVFIGRSSGDQLGAGIGLQGDRSHAIRAVGDVDGDGQTDFLLGSVRASPRDRLNGGEAYLIYGIGE